MSISHRITGLALSGMLSSLAIGTLVSSSSFPQIVETIANLHYGAATIALAKFYIAFPFTYHLCNGVRHLAWDLGKGFELDTLNKSGYAVVGLATILALVASVI